MTTAVMRRAWRAMVIASLASCATRLILVVPNRAVRAAVSSNFKLILAGGAHFTCRSTQEVLVFTGRAVVARARASAELGLPLVAVVAFAVVTRMRLELSNRALLTHTISVELWLEALVHARFARLHRRALAIVVRATITAHPFYAHGLAESMFLALAIVVRAGLFCLPLKDQALLVRRTHAIRGGCWCLDLPLLRCALPERAALAIVLLVARFHFEVRIRTGVVRVAHAVRNGGRWMEFVLFRAAHRHWLAHRLASSVLPLRLTIASGAGLSSRAMLVLPCGTLSTRYLGTS